MTHDDERFSVGVIGCGHWGPNHIRAFRALPGSTVTWAADTDRQRLRHIASLYDGVRVTPHYHEVLEDKSVDAVVIATPAVTHHELAMASLGAGKHVLCEKPLAIDSAQCRELVAAAAARNVVLMVGHIFLFNLGILALKELIDAGELGALYHASAVRANLGPIRGDVGVVYDLASHEVSIFNFLFDAPPLTVSACARSYVKGRVEDVAFITLHYPRDIIVGITVNWVSAKKVRTITLVGEAKMAVWDDLASSPVSIYRKGATEEVYYDTFGEFQLLTRDGDVTSPRIPVEEPLQRQARFFLEAIRKGTATVCSGERGWEVVQTLEAITRSIRDGGAPVVVETAGGPATREQHHRA